MLDPLESLDFVIVPAILRPMSRLFANPMDMLMSMPGPNVGVIPACGWAA
jgi:hypothetical protein